MSEQGTAEWMAQRCGRVTASRVADVIARTKSGYGASRANYMAELIAERLTGVKSEGYVNGAMQHGIDTEPQARFAYEFHCDVSVVQVGFIEHPRIGMTGASPDGLVGDDGLVEIKCPSIATHIDTLLTGAIAEKYITQMQWQMACTGRAWCDFVSFDNRMPESMSIFIQRVARDDARIKQLEAEVSTFLAELNCKVNELREKFETKEAA